MTDNLKGAPLETWPMAGRVFWGGSCCAALITELLLLRSTGSCYDGLDDLEQSILRMRPLRPKGFPNPWMH